MQLIMRLVNRVDKYLFIKVFGCMQSTYITVYRYTVCLWTIEKKYIARSRMLYIHCVLNTLHHSITSTIFNYSLSNQKVAVWFMCYFITQSSIAVFKTLIFLSILSSEKVVKVSHLIYLAIQLRVSNYLAEIIYF